MSLWRVLIPYDYQNEIVNPSVEYDSTGWAAIGGATVTRTGNDSDVYPTGGGYMMKCVSAASSDGISSPVTSAIAANDVVSLDLWVTTGVTVTVEFDTVLGTVAGNSAWQRVNYIAGGGAHSVSITGNGTFYVDRAMIVVSDSDTVASTSYEYEYIDGDQDGSYWTAAPHNSISKTSKTANAGIWHDLEEYGLTVIAPTGIGMPPINLNSQQQAFADGELYTGQYTSPRTLALGALEEGTSRAGVHNKRQQLINAIKDDRLPYHQGIWLEYSGGTRPVRIKCVYSDGLQVSQFNGFTEDLILNLVAFDPNFYEQFGQSQTLASTGSETYDYYGFRNSLSSSGNDWWIPSGTVYSPNSLVYAIDTSIDGKTYIGGSFTDTLPSSSANMRSIAYSNYPGGPLNAMDTGLGGNVYAIRTLPNGNVIAGGGFTTASSGTVNYIAQWDGTVWSGISGTDFDTLVYALAISPLNGDIYAGGAFTTAGGVAVNKIARYSLSSSAWEAISGTDFDNTVQALEFTPDGILYAGGQFTTAGGTTVNRITYIDTADSSATWQAMGSTGADNTVSALAVSPWGKLAIGGSFTTIGGISSKYLAEWDGTRFRPVSGMDTTATRIFALQYDYRGALYFGGTRNGSTDLGLLQLWNGFSTVSAGIVLDDEIYTIRSSKVKTNELFIGGKFVGCRIGGNTAITNTSTTAVSLIFHFYRSGVGQYTLQYITNRTTGQEIFLNYSLRDGERITIDTATGQFISNYRGVIGDAIQRGSDTSQFKLLPGINDVVVFADDAGTSPTIEAFAEWKITHWSADGGSST